MTYSVLCAKTKEDSVYKGAWIPLNGRAHKDEELGVHFEHYHIDWRFVSREKRGEIMEAVSFLSNSTDYYFVVVSKTDIERLEKRHYGEKIPFEPLENWAHWIRTLEREYAGQQCGGKRCPHRGADLSDCTPNTSGQITCPYHGLIIDQATMRVIDAFTREEESLREFHRQNLRK